MNGIKETMLAQFILVVGGVLATWVASQLSKVLRAVESKLNLDIDDKLEKRFENMAKESVQTVYKTYVKGLKESGSFTPEKQHKALVKAIGIIASDVKSSTHGMSIKLSEKDLAKEVEKTITKEKSAEKTI